jgi:DNA helicase-2/ATP-dependent DNA helicase PcrA
MTIHLAKGLEFPYVYIVGLEENLFPSAMSMNTRSEIEEERRLFYVALTRAEKQVYLSFANSRYRWGKLVDCEQSRFIEEIDENFVEFISSKRSNSQLNRFVNEDIFGSVPQNKIRFRKPLDKLSIKKKSNPEKIINVNPPKNLKKIDSISTSSSNLFDNNLIVGNIITHAKFGKGEVLKIEGNGNNKKAVIKFESGTVKNLLLHFAKLKIIG